MVKVGEAPLKMWAVVKGTSTIQGVRTNCVTGEESSVELSYQVTLASLYKLWFHISPGVTGYESFEFGPDSIRELPTSGWSACAGAPGRYDKLFIPAEEMKRAIDDIIEQLKEEEH